MKDLSLEFEPITNKKREKSWHRTHRLTGTHAVILASNQIHFTHFILKLQIGFFFFEIKRKWIRSFAFHLHQAIIRRLYFLW